jgi:ligand-binding sensor domain-containing protein
MLTRTFRILLSVLLITLFTFNSARSEYWQTITSGWNSKRIEGTTKGIWIASEGGLLFCNEESMSLDIYNKDDGLLTNSIVVAVEDPSTGLLWVGHSNGNVDVIEQESFKIIQQIRDLANDSQVDELNDITFLNSDVFVATNIGVSRLTKIDGEDTWVFGETIRGFHGPWPTPTPVKRMVGMNNYLYVGLEHGISRADMTQSVIQWEAWDFVDDLNVPADVVTFVNDMYATSNSVFVSALDYGIFKYESDGFERYNSINGFSGMISDDNGDLFVGRSDYLEESRGLFKLNSENDLFEQVNGLDGEMFSPYMTDITEYNGKIWGISKTINDSITGLLAYDGQVFDIVRPNTPGGDQIMTLEFQNDELWVTARSSALNGIYKIKDDIWTPFVKANTPSIRFFTSTALRSIAIDGDGRQWIGSKGTGLYLIEKLVREDGITSYDTTYNFDASNSLISSISSNSSFAVVNGVEIDPISGGVWVTNMEAHDNLTLLYIPPTWINKSPEDRDFDEWDEMYVRSDSSSAFSQLCFTKVDQNGRVWLGSWRSTTEMNLGVYTPRRDPVTGIPYESEIFDYASYLNRNGAEFSYINSMELDSEGLLWLATPDGLYYIDTNQSLNYLTFHRVNGALGETINCVAVDPLDQVWVGTSQGVSVLSNDHSSWKHHYTVSDGQYPSPLISNNINTIAIDPETGDVYIGTSEGISVVNTPYRNFDAELGTIEVAPQPFFIGDGNNTRLAFSKSSLIVDSDVKIYTASGRLVRELDFSVAAVDGWDGKNSSGEWVSSGVYLIVVSTSGGDSKIGKAAVIKY